MMQQAGPSEIQTLGEHEIFSVCVHMGLGSHPTSSTVGTRLFDGVKWLGHVCDHPPQYDAEVCVQGLLWGDLYFLLEQVLY